MSEEELLECLMDIDGLLSEAEYAIEDKKAVAEKIKEARKAIEEVRQDYDANDDYNIETDMMNKLK